jgi:hypothetical protein
VIPCPTCGLDAKVEETRTVTGHVRRLYRCVAGHRFSTREVPVDQFDKMIVASAFLDKVKEMARA